MSTPNQGRSWFLVLEEQPNGDGLRTTLNASFQTQSSAEVQAMEAVNPISPRATKNQKLYVVQVLAVVEPPGPPTPKLVKLLK